MEYVLFSLSLFIFRPFEELFGLLKLEKVKVTIRNNSVNTRRKKLENILTIFQYEYKNAKCHLNFTNPLELLIGCILSAQCTDERVNRVTKVLFEKYKIARDYAVADREELQEEIRSTGFFRNKAMSIISCCKIIAEKYNGEVPTSMEKLTELDGVGRKTANAVLGNSFGIPGVIVDTHVKRLVRRIGLSTEKDPNKIEKDLMEIVPQNKWTFFSNALSDHGRVVCKAIKPRCKICRINHLCPSADVI
jgi:endonuclease-3